MRRISTFNPSNGQFGSVDTVLSDVAKYVRAFRAAGLTITSILEV